HQTGRGSLPEEDRTGPACPTAGSPTIMGPMRRPEIQFSVAAMLVLVACLALNLWLFRLGFLAGFVGLNVTKHVAVAALCQALGVNGKRTQPPPGTGVPEPHLVSEA